MTVLLSIDVGIRNLGMCLMNSDDRRILHWDATGIPPQHESGLFPSLKTHFKDRPWVLEASRVIVEKQPDKNRTMKSVEHFIHAYFLVHDKDVRVYDARHKIPDVVGPGRAQYLKRKKASVIRCTDFLREVNPEWLDWFLSQKKKDDLADSVMQALSFLGSTSTSVPLVQKKKAPRKPTVNQRETKYSRANLAWLYVHGEHTKDTKRFEKDLRRYYRDVEEMLSDFRITEDGDQR